jgi:hypothetical protein
MTDHIDTTSPYTGVDYGDAGDPTSHDIDTVSPYTGVDYGPTTDPDPHQIDETSPYEQEGSESDSEDGSS